MKVEPRGWSSGRTSHGRVARAAGIVFVLLAAWPAGTSEPSHKALPILRDNCFSCHDAEKQKGGLLLTSREAVLKGGDSGVVVVPEKPGGSLLIKVLAPDADPHMPPKKQLAEHEIAALRDWIKAGAPWDESALLAKPSEKPISLGILPPAYKPVLAMAISPDGMRLAAGRGNRLRVHDLSQETRPLLREHEVGPDVVSAVACSPDGKHIAAGTYQRLVVLDASGKVAAELPTPSDRVTALHFLDDQTIVFADAAPGQPARLSQWAFAGLTAEARPITHGDSLLAISSIPCSTLITAGADRLVKVWDAKTGDEKTRLEGHPGHVLSLALKKDASVLASGGAGGEIRLWDLKTGERKNIIAGHPAAVTALAWSADAKQLYSACEDGVVRVCREDRNQPEKTLGTAGDMIYCLAVTPDGKTIFAGCHDGFVYIWDASGKLLSKL